MMADRDYSVVFRIPEYATRDYPDAIYVQPAKAADARAAVKLARLKATQSLNDDSEGEDRIENSDDLAVIIVFHGNPSIALWGTQL